MSAEASIVTQASAFAGLNSLIAGRIYADVGPQNAETIGAFVVYRLISSVPYKAMGKTVRTEYRYQFDSYAAAKVDAIALRVQVIAAFDFFSDSIIVSSLSDGGNDDLTGLDTETQLYRSIVDFKMVV